MIICSLKNAVSSLFYPHILENQRFYYVEGDPLGSPNKSYVAVISDQNYTI